MTRDSESTGFEQMLKVLAENGFEGMNRALEILVNEAMKLERTSFIGAEPYERSEGRRAHANGFKPKRLNTRVGPLELEVPQVRGSVDGSSFYPKSLEKGLRSERALKLAVAEMYVQGVSTRKVAAITQELCGLNVSTSQVSRAARLLDEEIQGWLSRPLGLCRYVILDARYEKVRHGGRVVNCAVLIAIGVGEDGKRSVLGVSVALSEAEVHWREFLASLEDRGLHGVQLIVSDDHKGLAAARTARFPSVPWQRCQFHLQRNAVAYVPKVAMRIEVAESIRAIFTAPNIEEAKRLLRMSIKDYAKRAPHLAAWMEENIPEGLTVFEIPKSHRRMLRTSNMLERVNRELKRRTRVATLFPNEASLLRLVSAVLMELSEEWETGKTYLRMESR